MVPDYTSPIIGILRRDFKQIAVLLGVAIAVKLAVLVLVPYPFTYEGNPDRSFPLQNDAVRYDQIAHSLMDGEGMKAGEPGHRAYDFRRPIFYPAFLAFVYCIFGYHILGVQLFQILMSSLNVILFYLLFLNYLNRRMAWIAALIIACYLPQAALQISLLTETWTTLLLSLLIFLLIRWSNTPKYFYLYSSGIVAGLLVLNRQFYKYLWIILVIWILWEGKGTYFVKIRNALRFVLPYVVIVIPYMIYVWTVTGNFRLDYFPISRIITMGNQQTERMLHRWTGADSVISAPSAMMSTIDETADGLGVVTTMLSNPGRLILGIVMRSNFIWLRSFWISPASGEGLDIDLSPLLKRQYLSPKHLFIAAINLVTILISLIGLVGCIRYGLRTAPIFLALSYTVLGFSLLYATDRFGIPIHPFIIMYVLLWLSSRKLFYGQMSAESSAGHGNTIGE